MDRIADGFRDVEGGWRGTSQILILKSALIVAVTYVPSDDPLIRVVPNSLSDVTWSLWPG